jgi:hypothetical protein
MTTHQLGEMLLQTPCIEVGYFDGEGHWYKATALRRVTVDEADWHPIGNEKQTGELRWVMEIESGYTGPKDEQSYPTQTLAGGKA